MANLPVELDHQLEANRLRAGYLQRLRKVLRRAPRDIREEMLQEVQAHIEDEWSALGGGLEALRTVLQRLGPPEEYGRDLALELILSSKGRRSSPARLALATLFWASTSLAGGLVVTCAALVFAFAVGMLVTAIARANGSAMLLLDARNAQVFGYFAEQLRFPPETWSPVLIGLVGLLPAAILLAGVYRFFTRWAHSRMALRGLELATVEDPTSLPSGWERRALLSMLVFAVLGMAGCLLFSVVGEMIPIGRPGVVRLPEDFFRTPLTALAFFSGLVFLVSPVLGLLWAAKRAGRKG